MMGNNMLLKPPVGIPEVGNFIEFEEKIMGRTLSWFHKEDVSLVWNNRFCYFILPRGHGKTTLFSIDLPIYLMYTRSNYKICLASSALEQSVKIMEEVQRQIENNIYLQWLKPEKQRDVWNKTQTNTSNGNQYLVKTFNPTIRSFHGDLFIFDDVLRDENLTQQEVKNIFWGVAFPTMMTRKGKIIVVGTPMTTDDLLSDFINIDCATEKSEPEIWDKHQVCQKGGLLPTGVKRQAVIIDDNGNWLEPLWKENFTLDELKSIKALQGGLIFDREYMTNPHAGSGAIFTEEILSKRHNEELYAPNEGCSYYLGVDVAISENNTADYSVFMVLEVNKSNLVREVRIERYRGKPTSWQINRIKELHARFNFRKIVIEDRGLSQGMAREMQMDMILRPVMELFVTTKSSKELIISRIESALSTGVLSLLDNIIHINELKSFGIKRDRFGKTTYEALSGHDDTVMALGFALEGIFNHPIGTASITFITGNDIDKEKIDDISCPYCENVLKKMAFNKYWCESCQSELVGKF